MQLCEKYRPQSWDEVVGQDAAVQRVKHLAGRGLTGRAYMISGLPGTGKSSIAYILAKDIATEWDIEEYDGQSLTMNQAKEIVRTLHLRGIGGGGRVAIVNEAHGMRQDVLRYLLVPLDGVNIPGHAAWVFTTTVSGLEKMRQKKLFDEGDDGPAFLSRCAPIALATADLTGAFAVHALSIARREGLDSQPLAAYVELVRRCKNNLRQVIQEIDAGAMTAKPGELFS